MDNRRRPIREYFDAARAEPGISEAEVRELVRRRTEGRLPGEGGSIPRNRKLLLGGGAVAALLVIALLLPPAGEEGSQIAPPAARATSAQSLRQSTPDVGQAEKMQAGKTQAVEAGGDKALASARNTVRNRKSFAISNRQQQTHTTEQQETMMISTPRVRSMTAAAVMMMGAASLSAQTHGSGPATVKPNHSTKQIHGALMKIVGNEMGKVAVEYWTPKLNTYKGRIDRMLTPADLEELNRLRVRFNVIANAFLHSGKEARKELITREKEELTAIYNSVKELAARYRSEGDALGVSVKEDIAGFFPVVVEQVNALASSHRQEIEAGGYSVMVDDLRGHLTEASMFVKQGPGKMALEVIYPIGIEPLLMLYDGTDLKTLLSQAERFFHGNGKGSSMFPTSAITGYMLPESSLLKQSVPNPASTTARIGYTLNEPSSRTLLRLFNAKGDLVGSYDQGSQPAGEKEATVDLSALPAGTYLYHLTIQTSKGEQVYSKTLQVVR